MKGDVKSCALTVSLGKGGHKAQVAIIMLFFASIYAFIEMLYAPSSSRAHIFILGHAGIMSGSKTSSYIRAIVFHKARHHSMQLWPCLFRWFRQWELEADGYFKSNFNHPAHLLRAG